MQKFNVAIIGCGLGGAATAIAIQRAGHQVTVYEQANGLDEVCKTLCKQSWYTKYNSTQYRSAPVFSFHTTAHGS